MADAAGPAPSLVEMSWDPITRIIGSLGIHTKIDFANRHVAECRSTSSIFRGYSVFMRGKDPRDAHFITSRICGICGDNHAACALYAQHMAFGVKPPPIEPPTSKPTVSPRPPGLHKLTYGRLLREGEYLRAALASLPIRRESSRDRSRSRGRRIGADGSCAAPVCR